MNIPNFEARYIDDVVVSAIEGGRGLLGDFDGNKVVDLADLDRYIGNIGAVATGNLEALDLNGDDTVAADDFTQHYTDLVETSNGGNGSPMPSKPDGDRCKVPDDDMWLVKALDFESDRFQPQPLPAPREYGSVLL